MKLFTITCLIFLNYSLAAQTDDMELRNCICDTSLLRNINSINLDTIKRLDLGFNLVGYFTGISSDSINHVIEKLPNLEAISLYNISLNEFPVALLTKKNLKFITLSGCNLKQLDASVYNFEKLEVLNLLSNSIDSIPVGISKLKNLRVVRIDGTSMAYLSNEIFDLSKLQDIELNHLNIKIIIPKKITKLQYLEALSIQYSKEVVFPKCFKKMTNIKILDLRGTTHDNRYIEKHFGHIGQALYNY